MEHRLKAQLAEDRLRCRIVVLGTLRLLAIGAHTMQSMYCADNIALQVLPAVRHQRLTRSGRYTLAAVLAHDAIPKIDVLEVRSVGFWDFWIGLERVVYRTLTCDRQWLPASEP